MQEEAVHEMKYTDEFGTYTIKSTQNCDHISDVIDNLVRPLLRAAGFTEKTLSEYLGDY